MTYAGAGVAALHHFGEHGLPTGQAAALMQAIEEAGTILAAHSDSFHSANVSQAVVCLVAAEEAAETAQRMLEACRESISAAVAGFAGGGA